MAINAKRGDFVDGGDPVCITSEGFGSAEVDLTDLKPSEDKKETMAAIIRGVAEWLYRNGHAVGEFDALVRTGVPEFRKTYELSNVGWEKLQR